MIHEVIIRQLDRCFYFVSSAVNNSSQEAWSNQGKDGLGVWQHAVHMIDALRFYCSRDTLKEHSWQNPFGLDYEARPEAESTMAQGGHGSLPHQEDP